MTLMLNHLVGFGAAPTESAAAFPQSLFTAGVQGAYYEIADLSTLFQESTGSGTTPASVNGVVGTIRDKSGLGNHLQAISDATRGILRQSGSLYYIEFDGADDTYRAVNNFTWAYPAFVGVTAEKAAQTTIVAQFGFFTATNRYFGIGNINSGSRCRFHHSNAVDGAKIIDGASNSFPVDTVTVLQAVADTNLIRGQSNADAEVENTATFDAANFTGNATLNVFRSGASSAKRFYGGIFLLNKAMTTADRNAARTWLGNLGGLSL